LSNLAAEIPRYYATPETRVACPDDRKFEVVAALTRTLQGQYEVIDVDGARIIFPDGWALVRASNTQPVLVVRAEGTTPEALEHAKGVLQDALRRQADVAPVSW
jgi:phosphomannomutase/phosphoglucomutase